jgi:hypothetical protein
MTIHEAKQILLTWRPGCPEREDASVREALALAAVEPELKEWLSAHRAMQERTARSLREIPVPGGLREAILQRARKVERLPVLSWWQQPMVWGAAAAMVLFLGLTLFWTGNESGASVEVFRSRMVGAVLRQYTMDIVTNDMGAVRSFLTTRQAPADYVLPEKLGRLPVSGAGVLSWQDGKVSMVCLDSPQRGTLFLFIVDAAAVRNELLAERTFADVNQLTTVTWTNGGRTYVLAGQGGRTELERYF